MDFKGFDRTLEKLPPVMAGPCAVEFYTQTSSENEGPKLTKDNFLTGGIFEGDTMTYKVRHEYGRTYVYPPPMSRLRKFKLRTKQRFINLSKSFYRFWVRFFRLGFCLTTSSAGVALSYYDYPIIAGGVLGALIAIFACYYSEWEEQILPTASMFSGQEKNKSAMEWEIHGLGCPSPIFYGLRHAVQWLEKLKETEDVVEGFIKGFLMNIRTKECFSIEELMPLAKVDKKIRSQVFHVDNSIMIPGECTNSMNIMYTEANEVKEFVGKMPEIRKHEQYRG